MSEDETTFDLRFEPWIPVLDLDGKLQYVGIRDALVRAHEYRDLAADLASMRFALLRILLAVCYQVFDNDDADDPIDAWADLWDASTLPADLIDDYLDRMADRFDLLHHERPFLQTPGLRSAKDEWKPPELLMADVDTNRPLFTMRSQADSLSLAEGARWLVHANAYDYSGIKTGAVGDDRVKPGSGKGSPMGIGWAGRLGGTTIVGDNFRETLLLNTVLGRPRGDNDVPIWEANPLPVGARERSENKVTGQVALLTWPQRRFRLKVERGRVVGVLVTNGDRIDYGYLRDYELMTPWRFNLSGSNKSREAVYMPNTLKADTALWRGISTLLPTNQPQILGKGKWKDQVVGIPAHTMSWLSKLVTERVIAPDRMIEIRVVSMHYGTQNASFADLVEDRLRFRAALTAISANATLRQAVNTAAGRTEHAVRAIGDFARNLDRAAGGDGSGASDSAKARAFALVDQEFRHWLAGLSPNADVAEQLEQWTAHVRRVVLNEARSMVQTCPPQAWVGREHNGFHVSLGNAITWFEHALWKALGSLNATEQTELTTTAVKD